MTKEFPKKLTVAALHRHSFFEFPENNSSSPKGIYGQLLETLAQILKFQYELTSPKDGQYGALIHGNWTGLIGMIYKHEADIGINGVSITQDRMEVVDFTIPFVITDATFVTQLPDTLPSAYTYLYSFDSYTWMCIFALLFLMPLAFLSNGKSKSSYFDTLMAVFAHLLKTSVSEKAFKYNPLSAVWYFGAHVISLSYAAVIASFLFVPLFHRPIKNFRELSEAVARGEYTVKVMRGTSYTSALINSQSKYLFDIGNAIQTNHWFLDPTQDIHEELVQSGVAFISHRLFLNMNFGFPPITTHLISEDGSNVMFLSVALSKTFCCKEKLNSILMRLKETGIISKFLQDEAHRAVASHMNYHLHNSHSFMYRSLSLKDLYGAVTMLMGGLVISFVSFITEIICYECCNTYGLIPL